MYRMKGYFYSSDSVPPSLLGSWRHRGPKHSHCSTSLKGGRHRGIEATRSSSRSSRRRHVRWRSYLSLRPTAHLAARLVGGRRSGFVCVARGRNQGRQTIVNSRKQTGEEGEERRERAQAGVLARRRTNWRASSVEVRCGAPGRAGGRRREIWGREHGILFQRGRVRCRLLG